MQPQKENHGTQSLEGRGKDRRVRTRTHHLHPVARMSALPGDRLEKMVVVAAMETGWRFGAMVILLLLIH